MKFSSLKSFAIAILVASAALRAPGQTQPPKQGQAQIDSDKGITGFESFQGTINSDNRIYKIDSNLGWDFNKHFGIFAGVPFYFANVPSSTTTTGTTTTTTASSTSNGLGNIYMG